MPARLNSGPAPDPNALRRERNTDGQWTTLPSSGRHGPLPAWPLPDQSDREVVLWEAYWSKPQAILWERNGQVDQVAVHVRTFTEAECRDCPAPIRTLFRQQSDALLLTIPAMLSARVRISADEVGERRTEKAPAAVAEPSSARSRLAG